LTDVTGELDADFIAGGTVAEPALVGEARLTRGSADLPAVGLELRDIRFAARGEGGSEVRLSGSVRSGTGSLNAEGHASLSSTADSLLRLHISGERFQVANTPEARVWASPELDVTTHAGGMTVEGEVLVPRAVVELREIPAMAVPVSRDVVLVGDTAQGGPAALDVRARIRLVIGDSVSFRGFGFSGRPSGSILATDEPGQPTSATGQLTVADGRYRAYGQDLTIETGRVIYAGGPIDNPGLDVRAIRHARDDVTAGLEVKGTLKSPEVTVFSDPPMMQSEALAYLLLGRPLTELSSSEGNRVGNAAISLGLSGGNLLAQRVSRRFGIDEAGIETPGSWEQASLYAGKYLSPRLYVSYGYGLFESSSLFRVRYILSRRWTLQAETGETTSTDIHFRIERGR
jgi:translocation and assembly module TamB